MDKRLDIHNSDVPVVCRSCEARHKGICGALSEKQLQWLSKQTTRQTLAPEQSVTPSPSTGQRYSNILNGIVKLSKMTSDGRQQIVGLQFAPDFLGRPFGRQPDLFSEAATEVNLCTFPKHAVETLIKESPELEHRLHEQALRELDEAREWMLTLGRKNAAERVASFLYMLATHANPEQATAETGGTNRISFEIPLKRSDIADFLGLTIETVSRQITKLRQSGVIALRENRFVEVSDRDRLRKLAEID